MMGPKTVVADVALLVRMAGYIEILVKDPHSTVFAPLSDIYRTFGLLDEAVDLARKGTEVVPSYAPGFVALGRALAERGESAAARAAFAAALELDAEHLPALVGLATLHFGAGETQAALELLLRAQQLDPQDEVVTRLLPVVQTLAARLSVAPPAAAPPPVRETAAVAEEAAEPFVPGVSQPPIATATLADIYIRQGFPEKALKVYGDLLQSDAGNAEIRSRYDALRRQIGGESPAVGIVSVPVEAEQPTPPVAARSAAQGNDALIALYSRWLAAVNRRRAHVH